MPRARDLTESDQSGQSPPTEPKPERTAAGEQRVLPGAERISYAELARRRAEQPLEPKARQKPPADQGLFSYESSQIDLVSRINAAGAEKPTES